MWDSPDATCWTCSGSQTAIYSAAVRWCPSCLHNHMYMRHVQKMVGLWIEEEDPPTLLDAVSFLLPIGRAQSGLTRLTPYFKTHYTCLYLLPSARPCSTRGGHLMLWNGLARWFAHKWCFLTSCEYGLHWNSKLKMSGYTIWYTVADASKGPQTRHRTTNTDWTHATI